MKSTDKDIVEEKNGYKIVGKANEYRTPWFCSVKDPDTGEKCGKLMGVWDNMWHEKYGMCENCVTKYNPHLVEALKTEDSIKKN